MNKISNHLPTDILQRKDAAHHIHPFSANHALGEKGARVIVGAKGVFLRDSDGNEILDGMAGLWCVNIGYGRKELAEVASQQMAELPYYNTFFQTTHPPAILLAEKLASLSPPNLNHVFFGNSGSDANDTNLRLVRHYWARLGKPEKRKVIARWNGYHGSSFGSGSLGGMKAIHSQGGLPIPDIHHIGQPHWYREGGDLSPEEFGKARAHALLEAIHEHGEDTIAAFIAEPVQGAGGVIVPPESYWPEVKKICDAHDILFIADEVICGFGRTGAWWGSDTYNLTPDIMTIAKGLSSGYQPIGGSLVSDHVAEVIGEEDFNHGYTYSGHPVACAVALENLRILEEERIIERVSEKTAPYLERKWKALADHPLVGEARICGMMGALELTPDKATRAGFEVGVGTVGQIARDISFANQLVMRHVGDAMIISPPLTISESEIDLLIERAEMVLNQTERKLRQEGIM